MANYYTHFSCLLDVGTPEKALRALDLYDSHPPDEDGLRPCDGFRLALQEEGGSQLWIYDNETGDPDRVIAFVLLCAEQLDLTGLWGFEWANVCSCPRLEAFGGDAHVLDLGARKSVGYVSTNHWLACTLAGGDPDA